MSQSSANRRGRSIHFTAPGEPLRIATVDVADPGPGEILVKLSLAGICGSDVHRLTGDLPFSGEPVCIGHEAVGTVVAVGAGGAEDSQGLPLQVADNVYWMPIALCGTCDSCRQERGPAFCASFVWPLPSGTPNAAAFQDYSLITRGVPVHRIPTGIDPAAVIAFGCAMPTAIGGFMRLGEVEKEVVIQGAGPVGLAATVLAVRAGARVIVIGAPRNRLEIALQLGGSDVIDLESSTPADRKARILEATQGRGPGLVIEAAGHISAFDEGMDLVASHGRYLIMGLYSGRTTTPFNPVTINNRNLTIIGSLGYPPKALARTVELAGEPVAAGFPSLITHRFPLERTDEAIATAARGEGVKVVVSPG